MIDTIAVYTNQTLAKASALEDYFVEKDLVAKTTWGNMVLHGKITGPAVPTAGKSIILYYALTSFTGVLTPAGLRSIAKAITIPINTTAANQVIFFQTTPTPAHGSKLYTWISASELLADVTLNMNAAGLP